MLRFLRLRSSWLLLATLAVVFRYGSTPGQEKTPPPALVALKDAPANTWARIAWSPTGGREQPLFVYVAKLGRFVMASGIQATGGVVPRHYDSEEFDLKSSRWVNAYPVDVAAGRPASGPVGDDYASARVKIGYNGPELFYKATGTSGQYTWNRIDPADWEKVANPDPERMKKFYADLPANQWRSIPFAKYAPGSTNRWGTSAYDTARQQILLWGGGHATSQENDVAHFSMRGGCWTLGYHPDDPIETVYASQPTPVSFADRPHVPVHAYRAYCYDPPADRMCYLDRAYDLSAREWESRPVRGLLHRGTMHSHMAPTPHGAVTFSAQGLFRHDAKGTQWVQLPWKGPRPAGIWCDGDGLRYDPKRDCLWLSVGTDLYRYHFKSGEGEKLPLRVPKVLGKYIFHAESAYLPDADLILSMRQFTRPDGTQAQLAFDPNESQFLWVPLRFVGLDGKEVAFRGEALSWHDALAYDADLKLAVLNCSSLRQVFVLRFDRKTAKLAPVEE
jgi:hypothetical protein